MNRLPALICLLSACAIAFSLGCSKSGESTKTEPSAPAAATQAQGEGGDLEAAIAAPGDKTVTALGANGKTAVMEVGTTTLAETETYLVNAKLPESVSTGADTVVAIHLVPKPGWKINQEFPTKLEVTAPEGVTLAKDSQSSKEAAKFTEKAATFNVSFNAASAGDKSFAGNFRFAVCTDATCDPKTAKLAWNLSVK